MKLSILLGLVVASIIQVFGADKDIIDHPLYTGSVSSNASVLISVPTVRDGRGDFRVPLSQLGTAIGATGSAGHWSDTNTPANSSVLAGTAYAGAVEAGDGLVGQNTFDYGTILIDKTFTTSPDLADFSFINAIGGTLIVKPSANYNQPLGFSIDVQGILMDVHVQDHGLTNHWGDVSGGVFWSNNDSDAPLLSMGGIVANSYNNGTNTCLNQYGVYTGSDAGSALVVNQIGLNVGYLTGSKVGNKYGLRIPDVTGATNDNLAIKTGLGGVSFGDAVSSSGSVAAKSFLTTPQTIAYASTVTVDFASYGSLATILAGSTTLSDSNQTNGFAVDYEFYNGAATNCNVILPSTWRIQSGAVTNILAPNASATLSMRYYSLITNTVALWASE
jgi:hypothetical protein